MSWFIQNMCNYNNFSLIIDSISSMLYNFPNNRPKIIPIYHDVTKQNFYYNRYDRCPYQSSFFSRNAMADNLQKNS